MMRALNLLLCKFSMFYLRLVAYYYRGIDFDDEDFGFKEEDKNSIKVSFDSE